jgi:hypothetical protein
MKRLAASDCRYSSRARTIVLAALLIAAQALAVSHVHQVVPGYNFQQQTQATAINDGLCALCLLHFNCPVGAGSPAIVAPMLLEAAHASPVASRLLASPRSSLFGRAPPVPS